MKKATFVDDFKRSIGSHAGTFTGSIIREEETPNNLFHNNNLRATVKGEENYEEI